MPAFLRLTLIELGMPGSFGVLRLGVAHATFDLYEMRNLLWPGQLTVEE